MEQANDALAQCGSLCCVGVTISAPNDDWFLIFATGKICFIINHTREKRGENHRTNVFLQYLWVSFKMSRNCECEYHSHKHVNRSLLVNDLGQNNRVSVFVSNKSIADELILTCI